MPVDISGFGVRVNLTASETFPSGLEITSLADDADPIDLPSVQLRDKAMGVNGDLVAWSKANPIMLTLAVIPNTDDDANLEILALSNRAAKGRRAVQDAITATVTYPDGRTKRLLRGVVTDGYLGHGVASAGRLKTKSYIFAFEDMQ